MHRPTLFSPLLLAVVALLASTAAPVSARNVASMSLRPSAQEVSVTSISPARGPMTGGNTVVVTGTGFSTGSTTAICRFYGLIYNFDGVDSPAKVASSTQLSCVVPGILCEGATYIQVSMDGGKSYTDNTVQYYYKQYFSAEAGLLPYTSETIGHIIVQVATDVASIATDLRVVVYTPSGVAFIEEPVEADGKRVRLQFTLAHLTMGANMTLQASLLGTSRTAPHHASRWLAWSDPLAVGDSIMLNRTFPLYRLPPKPYTVAVDRWTRGISVAGAPFLAYGYFNSFYNADIDQNLATLDTFAQQGFTHAITYGTEVYYNSLGKTLRAVVKYLTYAAFLGLRIQVDLSHWAEEIARGHAPVFGGNWTSQLDAITTVVQAFKEHPGVLSWYITDDTVPFSTSRVGELYTFVKKMDPYHPISNTFSGSGQAWSFVVPHRGFDVPQYEMYDASDPSYQSTTIAVTYPMQNIPGFICAEARTNAWVTRHTVRAQAYETFMFQGTSIVYWEFWPWGLPTFNKLLFYAAVQTGSEWLALAASVLSNDQYPPTVACTGANGWVAGKLFREDSGCMHITVLNQQKDPDSFTLSSPALAQAAAQGVTEVHVLWENRTVALSSTGNITDLVGSYGTHMYRFNCSAAESMYRVPQASPSGQEAAAAAAGGPAAVALHALVVARAGGAVNMIWNPSFENTRVPLLPDVNRNDASRCAFDLTLTMDSTPQPTFVTDSTTAVVGRNSLKLVGTQTSETGFAFIPPGKYSGLVNGTSYSVSVWVRVPAMLETQVVGMMLVLGTYGLPFAPLSPQAVTFTNADAWQWKQLTWSGVAPISGRVMLRIHGVGAVWMDNWEVYQN